MSRSGYNDDIDDQWQHIRWRGVVASATRGKRGQKLLKDILAGMDAMPEKRLAPNVLVVDAKLEAESKFSDFGTFGDFIIAQDGSCYRSGEVCAMGAAIKLRELDASKVDPESPEDVAYLLGINDALAREIAYWNDEGGWRETPEARFVRMREWIASQIWEWREVD